MALAILELLDVDEAQARFMVDTGTNSEYQLRFGRSVRDDDGIDRVDEVYFSPPPRRRRSAGEPFVPPDEVVVPVARLRGGKCFAQLFTSKPGGRAPALSGVVQVPVGMLPARKPSRAFSTASGSVMLNTSEIASHNPARMIPNRGVPLTEPASLEDILGQIVKIATPVVQKLITGPKPADGAAAATAPGAPVDILGQVLKTILGALSPQGGAEVKAKSLAVAVHGGNRFDDEDEARFAEPMIFGVDDALLASLVGPIVQVLPQLMNAANQKRIELKKADNALVGGILSDINKRMMMDKLLEAQKAAQAQGPASNVDPEQLNKVIEAFQNLPTASTAKSVMATPFAAAVAAPPAKPVSARAMLALELTPSVEWNGAKKAVYDRTRALRLKPRLVVAPPVPKAPLPKAILKVVLQDAANPEVRVEKVYKLKDVLANAVLDCRFEPAELSHLPPNTCCSILMELRWRTARATEVRALGSAELVLVDKHFVKARGAASSPEQELVDMARFRPFWNRIWEAPALDAARGGNPDKRKYSWELDVTARYSVLLSGSHESNALMETRLLAERDDAESMTLGVRGRMKAGIELSTAELNKLVSLWTGATPLEPAKLAALNARAFRDSAAGEFKHRVKLRGRAGQAGMVWVVPVFKLFAVTLSSVAATDDDGRVTATSEQAVQFPLPVAARVIGLKTSS